MKSYASKHSSIFFSIVPSLNRAMPMMHTITSYLSKFPPVLRDQYYESDTSIDKCQQN